MKVDFFQKSNLKKDIPDIKFDFPRQEESCLESKIMLIEIARVTSIKDYKKIMISL